MKNLRVIFRVLFTLILAVTLILPGLFKSFFSKNWLPLALRMRKTWARWSIRNLGVQLKKEGELPDGGPFIFIGNHRSYLDPIIALMEVEALPVAKAEVSSWPVIGYCAKVTGIMWVKRESKSSRADTIRTMKKTLEDGYSVLVYPEGTTSSQPLTQPFKKGAFRLSAELGVPIVPIAIHYENPADVWASDESFTSHFTRSYGRKNSQVKLAFGAPITGTDAKQVLDKSKTWFDQWLEKQATTNFSA
ncbi:MAG: lysophospholipid acyltransferase family protein [Bacteroidota bacterium]